MTTPVIVLPGNKPVKLGRLAPKPNVKVLKFKSYYNQNKDVSPPPLTVDYSPKAMSAISQMYLNDTLGDCVIADSYHGMGIWTGNSSGVPVIASNAEVQNSYTAICGPGDDGCIITDVLTSSQVKGLLAAGNVHKIAGYVAVDWTNKLEVMVALDIFGGLCVGVNLPNAWTIAPGTWDVTTTAIVGGHCIRAVGYNAQGVQICTWGQICTITWTAFMSITWVEELYACLSPDWYSQGNLAPNGIDATTLAADLASLGNGTIPNPNPNMPPIIPPIVPPPVIVPPPPLPQDLQQQVDALFAQLESQFPKESGLLAVIQRIIDSFFGTALSAKKDGVVNIQRLLAWIKAMLAIFGPAAVPVIEGYLATLNLPPVALAAIDALIESLLNPPVPVPAPVPVPNG